MKKKLKERSARFRFWRNMALILLGVIIGFLTATTRTICSLPFFGEMSGIITVSGLIGGVIGFDRHVSDPKTLEIQSFFSIEVLLLAQ